MKRHHLTSDFSRRSVLGGAAAVSGLAAFSGGSSLVGTKARAGSDKMDMDRFVEECVAASKETDPQAAVREVLDRAISTPGAVLKTVGEPNRAGISVIHSSPTLTIFNATWTPQMNLMPHNHLMWALIGIYTGREDNIMWRETPKGIEGYGAATLFEGDTASLPVDVVHSVTNPLQRYTGGIHIYGGDFFDTSRSQWNPETLAEEPSDGASIREMFHRENVRLGIET